MNTQALLEALEARDIHVCAVDGFLHVDAPRGMLTPTLRETLTNHKDDLVDALQARPSSPAAPSPAEPSRWARRAAALLSRIDDDELRVDLRDVFEETAAFLIRDGCDEDEEYEEGYEDEEHDRYTQKDDDEYDSEYENEDGPELQPMSAEEEEHPDLYEEEWPGAPTEHQALEMMRAVLMSRREVRSAFGDG